MTMHVKIAPSEGALPAAPEQSIGQSVSLSPGNSIALDIPQSAVVGYTREGGDLVVHLRSGGLIRVEGFYANPHAVSHLYLIEDDKLAYANLADAAPDGTVAATYAPEPLHAGFTASEAYSAGTEAAGTGTSSSSSWLGTAALIGGGVLAAGGAAIAVSGGGHDNASSGGGSTTTPPPDTTPPVAASNLTFSAQGTTLTGTAEAGATVKIDIDGDGKADVTATVGSNGQFQVTLPHALTEGQTVTVWVTDAAGNQSAAATAAAPDIVPEAPVVAASNGTVLSGTAEPGTTITITLGSSSSHSLARMAAAGATAGTVIGTTTADSTGHWSFTLSSPLANGTVVDVTATDPSGHISQQSSITIDAVAPTAPVTAPSNGTELSGTAEAGSTVTLTSASGTVIGTTAADSSGHWSFTPASQLANGTVIHITATDAAGNVSGQGSLTVDSVPPGPPAITTTTSTLISGTGEAGDTITLTDGTGHLIGTALVDSTGHWSITPTTSLATGSALSLTQTDPAGNISQPSTTTETGSTGGGGGGGSGPVTPGAPTITIYTGSEVSGTAQAGATITLTDAGGNVLGTTVADGTGHWSILSTFANTLEVHATASAGSLIGPATIVDIDAVPPAAPVLSGSNGVTLAGTGETGDTVTLTDGSGHLIGTTLVANGHWSFTPTAALANGTVVHVTQTDPAGNLSPQTTITTDTLLPSVPGVAANNGHEAFTGTGDVGDVVTISVGSTVLGTAVIGSNGSWSLTPSGPLGDGTVVTVTASNGGHSVSTTVTIDFVAPAAPIVFTSNGTLIAGTAEAGSLVHLTDGNSTVNVTVTADSTGHWSYTPTTRLANGDQVHATATDAAGNVSNQATISVDATPPAAPLVHVTLHGAVLSGTGDAGSTVTVTDGTGTMIGTTTVTGGGTWTLTPTVALDDGTVVRASQTDSAGNVSQQSSVVVDTVAPAAPIIAASNGTVLSGTAEANSTITLAGATGTVIATVTADSTGHWTYTPAAPLGNAVTVTATATDAAGNVSPANTTVIDAQAPATPTIAATDGSHVVGTAEAGSTITLTDGGFHTIATTDSNGNWSVDLSTTPLANGTQITVTATDAVGNTSATATITVDSSLAPIPNVDPSNGTVIHGHGGQAGDTIIIEDAHQTVLGQVTVQGDGTWSFTPGTPLANGSIVSAITDNGSTQSAASTITIDSTAPLAPTVGPSQGVTLGGTAEAGATITLTDINGNSLGTTTVGANGHWSVTGLGLTDGTAVHVTATDAAGNVSGVTSIVTDSTPPAAPVSPSSAGTIVSGTAEAGSIVTLTDSSGNTVLGTATAGANGYWSIVLATPQANGAILHAFATDAAGNQGTANTITVDSVAPTVPVIAASNGSVLTGTAEAGSIVTITGANGAQLGHTLAGTDGHWSFTPLTSLAGGTAVTATATDAAGNVSFAGSTTIDTTPPAAPTVALSNGQTITGTAEAGSTVILTDASNHAIGTATAGTDGHWVFQPSSPLIDGTHIVATATDAAGNVSAAGAGIVDAVAPGAPTIALRTATVLSGTAEAGSLITVTDNSGAVLGQITTGITGEWSFTRPSGPLSDGTVVHVTATDAAGNISAQTVSIIDAVAPAEPVINVSQGAVLTGSAEAGSSVVLTSGGVTIATVVADATGHWSFTPASTLADGTQITATAHDDAGNVSAPSLTLVVDSVAPGAPSLSLSNGTAVSGTAEAGSTITLTDHTTHSVIGTTVASASGTWSIGGLALANNSAVDATATDATGNVSGIGSTTVDKVAPNAPTVAPSNGTELHGTAEANSLITLIDGTGHAIGTTTTDSTGHWSLATTLANGTLVEATATDATGNISVQGATTVDSLAPTAPTLDPSNGMALSGTAEAGSTITLTTGAGIAIGTATTDSTGHWTFAAAVPLGDAVTVLATATDATGNVSAPGSAVIDATAPAAPIIDPTTGVVINGTAEANSTVILYFNDGSGTSLYATVLADISGHWSFKPSSPAPIGSFFATATDAAGNVSAVSTGAAVDPTLPIPPTVQYLGGGTLLIQSDPSAVITVTDAHGTVVSGTPQSVGAGDLLFNLNPLLPEGTVLLVTATIGGTASTAASILVDDAIPAAPHVDPSNGITVSGTAEAFSQVIATDGHFFVGAFADASGHWSMDFSLFPQADGTSLGVYVTSISGNIGPTTTITIDGVAPSAPFVAPTNGSAISGSTEAGATVTLFDTSNQVIATVTADGSGRWAYAPASPFANGTVIQVTATDDAGNVSVQATTTVDSVAPAAPTINPTDGQLYTGTGEPHSTITLTESDGNPIGQSIVGGNGRWAFSSSTLAGDGVVIHVTATDAAGNISAQGTAKVDAVPPAAPTIAASNGTLLHGTAEAGSTVVLASIATVTAAANGTWSFTPGSPLANGTVVNVVAQDATGNVSNTVTITIDSVAPSAPAIAASHGLELHGTGGVGDIITLTNATGTVIGSATVASNGAWSFTPATPLAGGTVVHASETDAAGNVSLLATATIDTTPPVTPSSIAVSANGTVVTGTTEANATITIIVNGDTTHPITGSADGSGHISISLSPALVDGQTLTVTATDAAGNVSGSVTAYAPELTPPVVTVAAAADGYLNAAEIAGGVIQTSVAITSGMHVGNTIAVTLNGTGGVTQTVIHTLVAADIAAGSATLSIPTTGLQQGSASITAALNSGASSSAINFTVDTTAPTAPGLSLLDNALTVSASPGSALVVDAVIGGVHFTENVTANSSGLASLNLLTDLGANLSWDQLLAAQISAYAVDAAGNTSSIASTGVAAHLVTPPTIGSFAVSAALVPPALGFSGTAGAGETLSVSVITPAATIHLAPTVDGSGHFSINLLNASLLSQLGLTATQLLNLGSGLSFEVTATDSSGHVSATYDVTLAGSGASLHPGTITVTGTSGDDILTASTGSVETFNAGAGNDLIQHVLGGDIVNAGAGNDTIQVKAAAFASIAGGTGFDTLLMETGITLDYSSGTPNVTGIERFNLGSSGTLTLTASAINTITDGGNVLQITGDATDTLKISGATNSGTTQTINGSIYDVYHIGSATLLVQEHTVHVVT